MSTTTPAKPSRIECCWCDREATAFYVSKSCPDIEIGFCVTCDPLYEPEVCSTHRAGCPGAPQCRDGYAEVA
jgi:hypothetical protein